MLTDGLTQTQGEGEGEDVQVQDVSQMLLAAVKRGDPTPAPAPPTPPDRPARRAPHVPDCANGTFGRT